MMKSFERFSASHIAIEHEERRRGNGYGNRSEKHIYRRHIRIARYARIAWIGLGAQSVNTIDEEVT